MSWQILFDILALLGAALLLGTIAERLRQSAILGYLLAGTLVGPNGLALVSQADEVRDIADLGVALLLFTIGLEFSFRRLRRLGRVALIGGSLQVVTTLLIAAAVSAGLGLKPRAAFAVGAMAALSSTACVFRLLTDRAEVDNTYGRNAVGILLLQDLAVIPLMLMVVLLTGASTPHQALVILGRTVLLAGLLVLVFLVLFNIVVPRLLNTTGWARNRELPILLAVVAALGSTYAAHAASLSPAMGAFVAGVLLGGSPFATQVRADVATLRTLLVTLFFTSLGMLGEPTWVVDHMGLVAGTVLLVTVGKTLITWPILRMLGFTHGVAVATGLCIAQIGEFSFVLAEIARDPPPVITADLFNLLVSTTIATIFVTPFLIAAAPNIATWIESTLRRYPPADGPVAANATDGPDTTRDTLIIGFGPAGQTIAQALLSQHRDRITVIELSPRMAAIARRLGLAVQVGDAVHPDVLEHAGVSRARVITITVPDPITSRTIVRLCRHLAPRAVIIARSRYHIHRWELEGAGATEVVDEEERVGLRIAAIARRRLAPRPDNGIVKLTTG